MDKKGFTLVELMAVIVIIGIVSLLAVVGMNKVRRSSDLKMMESNIKLIITAGETYGEDHFSKLNTTHELKVSVLKTYTSLNIKEEEYKDIPVYVYPKYKRAYACVAKSDIINNLSITSDEIKEFPKEYFCEDAIIDGVKTSISASE